MPNRVPFPTALRGNLQASSSTAKRVAANRTALAALDPARLAAAKRAYATRRFDLDRAATLVQRGRRPAAGDLVLARIDRLGHHRRLEGPDGRRSHLYVDDEVLLCFGNRYASDQFEALVPRRLEPCQMVAAGGIAARCVARHGGTRVPTAITPLGLVADADGRPLNLRDVALPMPGTVTPLPAARPPSLAVIGTAMNAGKTTTAAALVKGLSRTGQRVAVGKVTGTGAGGDRWAYVDAGAARVLDFTDFGYASTYRVPTHELAELLDAMVATLSAERPDVLVLEIADGLLFSETAELVATPAFARQVDDVVAAAGDSLGAEALVRRLGDQQIRPIAVAGRLTSSPLAVREAERVLESPVVTLDALVTGSWLPPRLTAALPLPA